MTDDEPTGSPPDEPAADGTAPDAGGAPVADEGSTLPGTESDPNGEPATAGTNGSSDEPEGSGRSRRLPMLIAAVVFVVVAGVIAALLLGGDEAGYTESTRESFLAACTADGGDEVRPACVCFYGEVVENIPYDRFDEVNSELLETAPSADQPVELPDDFVALLEGCRIEVAES